MDENESITKGLRFMSEDLVSITDRIGAQMVELPRDADGKPIHIGDTVYDLNGDRTMVHSLRLYSEKKPTWLMVEDRWGVEMLPGKLTHKRPDSWERIADELEEWRKDAAGDCRIGASDEDTLHDLADRIRRLAEREG